MRILQVFNRYLERGGEEISVERISNVLGSRHEVFHCYFDSAMWADQCTISDRIGQAARMFHNPDSVRRFRNHLRATRAEMVLFHNVFPVGSIGVFREAIRLGVPLFQLIHNFRPFSVNGYLWADDKLIPHGLKKNFIPEIIAGSWQGSRVKTAVYASVLTTMHISGIFDKVDGWLAISQFMRERFVEAGLDSARVHILRHSWDPRPESTTRGLAVGPPTLLFLGRLTEAKGIVPLLKAWELAAARVPRARLLIGGLGPLEAFVRKEAAKLPRCDVLGLVGGDQKNALLEACTAMVVPSVWWEALGLVAYEAYDFSKPVLAANSGGLAESVVPGETGWLHTPGNAAELADQMVDVLSNPAEAFRRGLNGRHWLVAQTRRDDWLDAFDEIVGPVIMRRRSNQSNPRS